MFPAGYGILPAEVFCHRALLVVFYAKGSSTIAEPLSVVTLSNAAKFCHILGSDEQETLWQSFVEVPFPYQHRNAAMQTCLACTDP